MKGNDFAAEKLGASQKAQSTTFPHDTNTVEKVIVAARASIAAIKLKPTTNVERKVWRMFGPPSFEEIELADDDILGPGASPSVTGSVCNYILGSCLKRRPAQCQ